MGFSERVPEFWRLADRVADLGAVTAALGITGPVVTVAHDWGGAVSLGWALAHRDQLAGIVLSNTAIALPAAGIAGPRADRPGTHPWRSADGLRVDPDLPQRDVAAGPAPAAGGRTRGLPGAVRDGAARRRPSATSSPTSLSYQGIRPGRRSTRSPTGLGALDVPVLLLWGPRDPVFGEAYLDDLRRRLPHADVHRYPARPTW